MEVLICSDRVWHEAISCTTISVRSLTFENDHKCMLIHVTILENIGDPQEIQTLFPIADVQFHQIQYSTASIPASLLIIRTPRFLFGVVK